MYDKRACKNYEASLEGLVESGGEPVAGELAAHLERCTGCHEALEAARLSRDLLREGQVPMQEPGRAFAVRVMASIRAEEDRRQQFWRPLEVLASRLALTATVALLVLTAFLFDSVFTRSREPLSAQSETSEGFPELGGEPSVRDEVLLTLAGSNHGR